MCCDRRSDALQTHQGQGLASRHSSSLIAVVAQGKRGREYLPATTEHQGIDVEPLSLRLGRIHDNPRDFKTPGYGIPEWHNLFTARQLVALTTFSDLLVEVKELILADAAAAGLADDGKRLRDDGRGSVAVKKQSSTPTHGSRSLGSHNTAPTRAHQETPIAWHGPRTRRYRALRSPV